jgi:hypothetical protein
LEIADSTVTLRSGLQKLAEDRLTELTANELFGLEAIVLLGL